MEGPLLKGLYWEYAYNAGTPRTICPGGEEARALGPCPLAPSDRNILYENRLLGLPRYFIDQNAIFFNKFGIKDISSLKSQIKIQNLQNSTVKS